MVGSLNIIPVTLGWLPMNDVSESSAARLQEENGPRKFLHSSNFFVLIFGTFMLVGLLALAWLGRPPQSTMVGQSLPRLDLQPLLNVDQPVTNLQLDGSVSVIHFWGTWCPPCKLEFPEFATLVEELAGQQVTVISVSCSQGPELDLEKLKRETATFLDAYAIAIPTYSDNAAMTRQQLAMLSPSGSFGYPTTLVIDRGGTIIHSLEGYRPGEMQKLARRIQDAL